MRGTTSWKGDSPISNQNGAKEQLEFYQQPSPKFDKQINNKNWLLSYFGVPIRGANKQKHSSY